VPVVAAPLRSAAVTAIAPGVLAVNVHESGSVAEANLKKTLTAPSPAVEYFAPPPLVSVDDPVNVALPADDQTAKNNTSPGVGAAGKLTVTLVDAAESGAAIALCATRGPLCASWGWAAEIACVVLAL